MKRQFKSCGIASKKHLGRLKKLKDKKHRRRKKNKKICIEAETERKINRNTPKNHKTSR
jgi:hypothetical protein